jgi:hypothetical protein
MSRGPFIQTVLSAQVMPVKQDILITVTATYDFMTTRLSVADFCRFESLRVPREAILTDPILPVTE